MEHWLVKIEIRDGESEYTTLTIIQVPDDLALDICVNSYLKDYWGYETTYHDGAYWSKGDMQCCRMSTAQLIESKEDKAVLNKYGIH